MSKRFGRNRRRRMREQIAALKSQNRLTLAVAERNKIDLRIARNEIERAKMIAGRYCAAFEPDAVCPGGRPQPYVDITPLGGFHQIGHGDDYRAPSRASVLLPVLLTEVSDEMDRRAALHALVQYDGMRFGYAISRDTLLRMDRNIAIERIAKQFARQLLAELDRQR